MFYLLPEYFGKGYGKALMDFVLNDMKQNSFSNVYLWALRENTRARRFYEKNGFYHDGKELICPLAGDNLVDLRYVKAI